MNETEFDRNVRIAIARSIRERARVPTIAEVATALKEGDAEIDSSFARMIDGHVFTPRQGSHEIYAFHPFCADPTDFRVRADGRDWWAVCGWDALGIPTALGADGAIEAHCGDCAEPIRIQVGRQGRATASPAALLQIGVPARDFWKDIHFT